MGNPSHSLVLDYGTVAATLCRANATAGAAETHGILCGMLCAAPGAADDAWLDLVLENTEPGDLLASQCRDLLVRLRRHSARELESPEYVFQPLLPPDEEPLTQRSEALGDWCGGFLYALGIGGIGTQTRLTAELREFLDDLVDITHIDSDPQTAEEDELAYAEVVEYVRMGVLMASQELRGKGAAAVRGPLH